MGGGGGTCPDPSSFGRYMYWGRDICFLSNFSNSTERVYKRPGHGLMAVLLNNLSLFFKTPPWTFFPFCSINLSLIFYFPWYSVHICVCACGRNCMYASISIHKFISCTLYINDEACVDAIKIYSYLKLPRYCNSAFYFIVLYTLSLLT